MTAGSSQVPRSSGRLIGPRNEVTTKIFHTRRFIPQLMLVRRA